MDPVFARESEMASSVARWMRNSGLVAKSEFVTPWGICDLVGIHFNPRNIARRIKNKQLRSVCSITRALLLSQIPDIDKRETITLEKLIKERSLQLPEDVVRREMSRLIADGFVVSGTRQQLQKINGWMPLQDRLVAVELKLSRIDEALRQAMNNLGFAEESYVALPRDVARRVASKESRWSEFFNAGVGLLAVGRASCKVLKPARATRNWIDEAIQFYSVEKFWSTRLRDRSSSTPPRRTRASAQFLHPQAVAATYPTHTPPIDPETAPLTDQLSVHGL